MILSLHYNIGKLLFTCVIVVVFAALPAQASAQASAQTKVTVTADRTRILIGEPIALTLVADIPENEPIRFFTPDSMAHFELLRRDPVDTSNTAKGTVLTGIIYVTSFDSGHWVIPPFTLRDSIRTDSIAVDVGYTPFDVNSPYNDVHDILEAEVEKPAGGFRWWYAVAAVAVLAGVFYLAFRRKKQAPVPPVVSTDPYRDAIERLQSLREHAGTLESRLYYGELVDVFRRYVARRKAIESMQQTTGDLVDRLRALQLPAPAFDRLAVALQLSDLVKFARFSPTAAEDELTHQTITECIELIEKQSIPAHVV